MLFGINVSHTVPTRGPATWVFFVISRLLPPAVHIFIWKDPQKGLPNGQKMTNPSPKFLKFAHALLGCTHCSVCTWLHASNSWALLAHLEESCKQIIPVPLQKYPQPFTFPALHWLFLHNSFSLSFPPPSLCLTSRGVPRFPSPRSAACEQLMELIVPVFTHPLSLPNSAQFSAGEAVASISFILVDKWWRLC